MRNDDDLGVFENLTKARYQFTFCCAIQSSLRLAAALRLAGFADQPSRSSRLRRAVGQDDLHPAPRRRFRRTRAIEVRTAVASALRKPWPLSSFTRLCRPLGLSRDRRLQSWTGALLEKQPSSSAS